MPLHRWMRVETVVVTPQTYWRLKRLFFSKHSYRGGDHAPLIPYTVLVKRDVEGRPTECHLPGGVTLHQAECIVLLELARRSYAVPLLRARWLRDHRRFVYAGAPRDLQEAVLLLEDVPAEPVEAVINNVFEPPRQELDGRAELVLLATATATTLDEKYPTILLLVGGLDTLLREAVREVGELLVNDEPQLSKAKSLMRLVAAAKKRVAEIAGQTVTVLVVSHDPPLAFYPIFLG